MPRTLSNSSLEATPALGIVINRFFVCSFRDEQLCYKSLIFLYNPILLINDIIIKINFETNFDLSWFDLTQHDLTCFKFMIYHKLFYI